MLFAYHEGMNTGSRLSHIRHINDMLDKLEIPDYHMTDFEPVFQVGFVRKRQTLVYRVYRVYFSSKKPWKDTKTCYKYRWIWNTTKLHTIILHCTHAHSFIIHSVIHSRHKYSSKHIIHHATVASAKHHPLITPYLNASYHASPSHHPASRRIIPCITSLSHCMYDASQRWCMTVILHHNNASRYWCIMVKLLYNYIVLQYRQITPPPPPPPPPPPTHTHTHTHTIHDVDGLEQNCNSIANAVLC